MSPRPSAVLFACTLNRVRSPMAAALGRRLAGSAIYMESCGLEPAEAVDPFAVAVMAELGLDVSGYHPKSFEALADGSFDLVVSLTPEAHARAIALARGRAVEVEYWPTDDPTLAAGSREQRLEAYRAVRDSLGRRIAERFADPSTSDGRTA